MSEALRKAAALALDALVDAVPCTAEQVIDQDNAIDALRAALAEPEQEPDGYIHRHGNHWEVSGRFLSDDEKARGWTEEPLFARTPRRVPLTQTEVVDAFCKLPHQVQYVSVFDAGVRFAEQYHGIGGKT
jgi:hypothetical protein